MKLTLVQDLPTIEERLAGAEAAVEKYVDTAADRDFFERAKEAAGSFEFSLFPEVCLSALSMLENGYDIKQALSYGLNEWDI